MSYHQEHIDILRLFRSENVGPITFFSLIKQFGNANEAIHHVNDLSYRGGRKKKLQLMSISDAEKELDALKKIKGEMIFYNMHDFPEHLKHISDPPPLLSIIGHKDLLCHDKEKIAIIGARNASSNSLALTKRFAQVLSEDNFIIVSGMAIGIDGAAHKGAIDNGTIAVLAGGIDHIYPKQHQKLYWQIADQGLLVSEMPLGMSAQARHFPRRNRIVSGLSLGILVIEASLKSGSLITARLAAEQNREVFAVPASPMMANARGCNQLIKNGAYLTETPDDIIPILRNFPISYQVQPPQQIKEEPTYYDKNNFDNYITRIRNLLSHEPTSCEQLMLDCDISAHELRTILTSLALAGDIMWLPGDRVCLKIKESI